jgi:hypothetical protein
LLNFKDGVAKTMMDNLLEDIERQRARDIALKNMAEEIQREA